MNPILRNVLAVIAGMIIGMIVNMAIVILSVKVVSYPEGVSAMDPESIKANIHLFTAKHFVLPFLAHALGTLVGAFAAVKIGASNHMVLAMVIGVFFLAGGIMNQMDLQAPSWFAAVDLIAAYIPMAWLGYKMAGK